MEKRVTYLEEEAVSNALSCWDHSFYAATFTCPLHLVKNSVIDVLCHKTTDADLSYYPDFYLAFEIDAF